MCFNRKQSRCRVKKMAAFRRVLTSATKISTWVNSSFPPLKSTILAPVIEGNFLTTRRSYRGSNRYKKIKERKEKIKLEKQLEIEYGISNKLEFNFKEWIKSNYFKEITAFQQRIGVVFTDDKLLVSAFTHSSFREELQTLVSVANQDDQSIYPDLQDRLEISENLSDVSSEKLALLGFDRTTSIVKENLYKRYRNITSSICSDVLKYLTSRETIVMLAKSLGLEDLQLMSKELENIENIDEEYQLQFTKEDVLCDTFFALIGAIEKDAGIPTSKSFVEDFIIPLIDHTDLTEHVKLNDAHSELMKILSLHGVEASNVRARTIVETGVDTNFPFYFVGVYCKDIKIGEGSGYSAYTARKDAFKNTVFSCVEGDVDFSALKRMKSRV